MKKTLSLVLALMMILTLVSACTQPAENPDVSAEPTNAGTEPSAEPTEAPVADVPSYTYNSYSTSLANNWNPHTWETNADDAMNAYLTQPFVTMQAEDTENGVYQWVYEMATEINDVTASHQDDLTKYAVNLPADKTAADITEGYVFELKLNPNAKWQDGTPINADSYIYSMQQLLNPQMRNYRANLYYAGESAVAGGSAYYNAGAPIYNPMVAPYGEGEEGDYSYDLDAGIESGMAYVNVTSEGMTLYSMSLSDLNSNYGLGLDEQISALGSEANPYGYTQITAENKETVVTVINTILSGLFGITDETEQANYLKEALFVDSGEKGAEADYDTTVGCYKVDDYTINYVMESQIDYYYALTSFTSNWLVYEDLYEAGKDTTGTLVTTNYGTSVETSMSYGPYKLVSMQDDKQMIFEQNENWYGWEQGEDGTLVSYTTYDVDGETKQRYRATRIVIDVMTDDAAKQAFLKGELTDWAPSAEEVPNYATSEQLYKADETYTMSFFFNCGLDALKTMDEAKGNTNSVVMSNINFRKAFSFAIDRNEWVGATAGYTPSFGLMNNQYYYDFYNNPDSMYRLSDPAMQAVCDMYGVQYGEGTPYATLKDAYKSINGYNLTEAKELMATACKELVDAGLYTEGQDIVIRIGYKKGALDSTDNKQVELMNKYINAAAEGSGFGKITLEALGNISDRYGDVAKGEYAIGYGAWGGAALYPFRNFQVYCDNEQYDINEAGCWDPSTEKLTLNVNGEDVTMSWRDWSRSMIGTGVFAGESNEVKLQITAKMEELYLQKYYRIPLATSTSCTMLAYKCNYYTPDYNLAYGWGGMELLVFNYNDAEWNEYVASQGGTLSYE